MKAQKRTNGNGFDRNHADMHYMPHNGYDKDITRQESLRGLVTTAEPGGVARIFAADPECGYRDCKCTRITLKSNGWRRSIQFPREFTIEERLALMNHGAIYWKYETIFVPNGGDEPVSMIVYDLKILGGPYRNKHLMADVALP